MKEPNIMTEKLLSGFILVTMTLLSMPARSAEYEYEKPEDYETVTKDPLRFTEIGENVAEQAGGAALHNTADYVSIINKTFQNNRAETVVGEEYEGYGYTLLGGAVYNDGDIDRIKADFVANSVAADGADGLNAGGGALYKYNPKTGEATDISPTTNHAYGAVYGDPNDANKLIATSCDFGYSQMWDANAWKNDTVAWGSQFYRSTDGGATWESITPGNETTWGGPLQADYLQDGGRPWIRGYAVHWSGACSGLVAGGCAGRALAAHFGAQFAVYGGFGMSAGVFHGAAQGGAEFPRTDLRAGRAHRRGGAAH